MSARDALRRVDAATVRLPEAGGRGVLVHGGLVLTATHCLGWDLSPGWVLGDHHPVRVEVGGRAFRLGPWYADAVSDMAALGVLDNQEFPDDEDTFDEWRRCTSPVPLSPWVPKPRLPPRLEPMRLPVHLLSLKADWSRGELAYWGSDPCGASVAITADQPIECGMSGGPVVDARGRLAGVVSTGRVMGTIPLATMALPAWIVGRINRGR